MTLCCDNPIAAYGRLSNHSECYIIVYRMGDVHMKKIGVISDTHIFRRDHRLPSELLAGLQGVELMLHAGDIGNEVVLEDLERIAPVHAVAGNTDPFDLEHKLGRKKLVHVAGMKIGLIHGDGARTTTVTRALTSFPEADCIVFGHTHKPYNQRHGKVLMFNPGSPTDYKRPYVDIKRPSFGLLTIANGSVEGQIVYL